MKIDNIILIGLMGAGKSTIGKLLTEQLNNFSFVDIDNLIEKNTNMSINDIFNIHSESFFREKEYETIQEIIKNKNQVISLGGGAFENSKTRELLASNGVIFYLKASPKTLYSRIKNEKNRPLLKTIDPELTLAELLKIREQNYLKANYIIDTNSIAPYNIVKNILGKLNEHNN